jgi:hypothetical protein
LKHLKEFSNIIETSVGKKKPTSHKTPQAKSIILHEVQLEKHKGAPIISYKIPRGKNVKLKM